LTELVQEGILRPDYEKELHRLNDAGKSSKPFEAFCQDYIDLVLDLYSEAIDVPDGDIQLEALTKKFGDLHLEYGETPNFPPVPPDDMTGYQQWNYCPESLANAPYFTKEDLKKHMRTSREAACLRAYNKMLPESAAEENHVPLEDGYNTVNHCVDLRTTCPNIPNDAPNRNKLYNDDCKRVCGVFDGIRRETLDVPAICHKLYAAIKHRRLHNKPLLVSLFTSQAVKIWNVPKEGARLNTTSRLIVFMFRFPHGELLVNITFLKRYRYEELVEFGECFVEWLRETNPFIKLPEKAVSTWFVRRVFGKDSLTPEEIAAHNDLCRALCQKGAASRWLRVIRPNLTKEDRDELLRDGFTCAATRCKNWAKREPLHVGSELFGRA
jgi:hypothetical protein